MKYPFDGDPDHSAERALFRALEFRGTLAVRATADGGRAGPISSGYRPDASLTTTIDELPRDGSGSELHGIVLEFEGPPIEPGASGPVSFYPRHPEFWRGVRANQRVGLYEGHRRTATVTIAQPPPAEAIDQWLQFQAAKIVPEAELERRSQEILRATEDFIRPRDGT